MLFLMSWGLLEIGLSKLSLNLQNFNQYLSGPAFTGKH